ncbi:NAD(P)-binding domain-containing protein [Variovorax sp. RA8]|uniref:NAD(P)-binding domain-containing protein n=1 Tax=Variovorax sp. (strain JCM 16519 / RA8) TaxID=662548 RepID=UPI001316F20C|nr:6-phosphogluconate dehydrogenase, decarboxylating [Variovorax sp. RA8]
MQIRMIGLGQMGANMTRRLMRGGHDCVVYAAHPASVERLTAQGATGSASLQQLVTMPSRSRAIWLMVSAAVVDQTIGDLLPLLDAGDIAGDGGNSYCPDDLRRAADLRASGIHCVDVGTRAASPASIAATEAAWTVVELVLAEHPRATSYPPGSWGPPEADRRIAADGGWRNPEPAR